MGNSSSSTEDKSSKHMEEEVTELVAQCSPFKGDRTAVAGEGEGQKTPLNSTSRKSGKSFHTPNRTPQNQTKKVKNDHHTSNSMGVSEDLITPTVTRTATIEAPPTFEEQQPQPQQQQPPPDIDPLGNKNSSYDDRNIPPISSASAKRKSPPTTTAYINPNEGLGNAAAASDVGGNNFARTIVRGHLVDEFVNRKAIATIFAEDAAHARVNIEEAKEAAKEAAAAADKAESDLEEFDSGNDDDNTIMENNNINSSHGGPVFGREKKEVVGEESGIARQYMQQLVH